MEATTSRTQRITKDYFPWLKESDRDFGNKPLWNEAAAAMEVFLKGREKIGDVLKDAVQDFLIGYSNNIDDSPFEYQYMLMKLLKALGNPSVQQSLNSIDIRFDAYDINRLDLLIEFFTKLMYSKELKSEVKFNHFLDYPNSEDAVELIAEYTALAEVQKSMKNLRSTQ